MINNDPRTDANLHRLKVQYPNAWTRLEKDLGGDLSYERVVEWALKHTPSSDPFCTLLERIDRLLQVPRTREKTQPVMPTFKCGHVRRPDEFAVSGDARCEACESNALQREWMAQPYTYVGYCAFPVKPTYNTTYTAFSPELYITDRLGNRIGRVLSGHVGVRGTVRYIYMTVEGTNEVTYYARGPLDTGHAVAMTRVNRRSLSAVNRRQKDRRQKG